MFHQGLSESVRVLSKALCVVALLAAPLTVAFGQQATGMRAPGSVDMHRRDPEDPLATMEEEMKAKRAIKEADRQYRENLERARDLSELGTTIVSSFKQKNWLDERDLKKLEKVEKLAKGIRSAAGGSEDEVEMEKPPKDMACAVEMLGELSQSLKAKVEKTPKHVISAAVIDEANVLLELIRILRTLPSSAQSKV
jgi:hypothetical protein